MMIEWLLVDNTMGIRDNDGALAFRGNIPCLRGVRVVAAAQMPLSPKVLGAKTTSVCWHFTQIRS